MGGFIRLKIQEPRAIKGIRNQHPSLWHIYTCVLLQILISLRGRLIPVFPTTPGFNWGKFSADSVRNVVYVKP